MNFTGTNPQISDKGDIIGTVHGEWRYLLHDEEGWAKWSISYDDKVLCLADAIKYREAEEAKEKKKKRR